MKPRRVLMQADAFSDLPHTHRSTRRAQHVQHSPPARAQDQTGTVVGQRALAHATEFSRTN
jgi:hypothetical protein